MTAWGRLGYPRRALRLHAAAVEMVANHKGEVPQGLEDLITLPGIGDYTARAIRTFAFGIPEPVVDTNVRRVVARAHKGNGEAGPPRVKSDRQELWGVLSTVDADTQVQGAKAIMELGATICTARTPRCEECPLAPACAWRDAGYPEYVGAKAPAQARFEGSDRQVRGIILRELRHSDTPVPEDFLASLWPDHQQFQRALDRWCPTDSPSGSRKVLRSRVESLIPANNLAHSFNRHREQMFHFGCIPFCGSHRRLIGMTHHHHEATGSNAKH